MYLFFCSVILEFIFNLFMDHGSIWQRIINFDRIIECCNIFEIFWFFTGNAPIGVIYFFPIFRSMRAIKIRR